MVYQTDINDDGQLDAVDIALVRGAFGTSDPQADVNDDGTVNATDIGYVRFYTFTEAVGTPNWDFEEEACFAAINDYRAHPERWQPYTDANGVVVPGSTHPQPIEPLRRSYRLSQAAQWMAQDQVDHGTLSHVDSLGRDVGMRIRNWWDGAKYGYMGENGLGTDGGGQPASGASSCLRWTLSPPHNGGLLGGHWISLGIGHAIADAPSPPADQRQHRWYLNFSSLLDTAPWP